jgi:hypothetical protein
MFEIPPEDLPETWRERIASDGPTPRGVVLIPPPRDDMRATGLTFTTALVIGLLVLNGAGSRLLGGAQGDGALLDATLIVAMLGVIAFAGVRFARAIRRGRPSPAHRQGIHVADDGLLLMWGARATLLPRDRVVEARDRPLQIGAFTVDRDSEVLVRTPAGERRVVLPIRRREREALETWIDDPAASFGDLYAAPA